MTKITFRAQPQRSDGTRFIDCEIHRATSFAVVKTEKFTRDKVKYTIHRVVERCKTLPMAMSSAASRNAVLAKPERRFRLGNRYPIGGKPLFD